MLETIAVLCSDMHLSHKPSLARSGEPDWYEAMGRPLRELRDLSMGLPVLCAGDVFDRWNSPPELINFAVENLPNRFWSVAGQHDIPYHNWRERKKSAFWTLVEAQVIRALWDDFGRGLGTPIKSRIRAWGYNWGEDVSRGVLGDWGSLVKVCIAHQYVWIHGFEYPGVAMEENKLSKVQLRGYDVALFGDNHKGFVVKQGGTTVFNAGSLMRRHADEVNYQPKVGLLLEDGMVQPHCLDTSRDVFDSSSVAREAEQVELRLDSFLSELGRLGESGSDFCHVVEVVMDREQVSRSVRRVILEAMEQGEKG